MSESVKVLELVFDYDLYPRTDIDAQHVGYIAEAYHCGAALPPIWVCRKTKKIIDGFHRCKAKLRLYGDDAMIELEWKDYANDKERFLDAVRSNAPHGEGLDRQDRVHCSLIAKRLSIGFDRLSEAMKMSSKTLKDLVESRTASLNSNPKTQIPLKRTIEHMAGGTMTQAQVEVNKKLSGMDPKFSVNQLLMLLRNDLINEKDAKLLVLLRELAAEIEEFLAGRG